MTNYKNVQQWLISVDAVLFEYMGRNTEAEAHGGL